MSMFRRLQAGRGAWAGLAALMLAVLFFGGSVPTQAQSASDTLGDYGDAPDTTNSTQWTMDAYPWNAWMQSRGFIRPPSVPANYPTVFDPAATTPQGPWHRHPKQRAWLGQGASREEHADHGADGDIGPRNIPANNIEPKEDTHLPQGDGFADMDAHDDSLGYNQTIALPDCGLTSFTYAATGAADAGTTRNYLNVWVDFNRDGDFNDTILCKGPGDTAWQSAPEHAVKNMPVLVAPGANTLLTSPFRASHPEYKQLVWMRMTLTGGEISGTDGSGPADGYRSGETEDYILTNHDESAAATDLRALSVAEGDDYQRFVLNVSYYTGGY